MEATPTPVKCHLWHPYSGNPERKTVQEAVDAPDAPIGISELIDPSTTPKEEDVAPMPSYDWNPDLHIMMRALEQAGLATRVIRASPEAAELPHYRELVNYWIEFTHKGETHTLDRPFSLHTRDCKGQKGLPPTTAGPTAGDPRQLLAERIRVTIQLRDPAGNSIEEHRFPVDLAFLDADDDRPMPGEILLSTERDQPTVPDLAELITNACFLESDGIADDTAATQLASYRNHAYETAANLLLPRTRAVAAIVERHIKETFASFLEDGERLEIEIVRYHGKIGIAVVAKIPPRGEDIPAD